MVVDSSALIAVWQREPGWGNLREVALRGDCCLVSAPNFVETVMVVEVRRGPSGVREMEALMHELLVEVSPFDLEQAHIALHAFRRFGRGRHPARLNLGDCFAYALAVQRGLPLLFKGDDFARTDIEPALLP